MNVLQRLQWEKPKCSITNLGITESYVTEVDNQWSVGNLELIHFT